MQYCKHSPQKEPWFPSPHSIQHHQPTKSQNRLQRRQQKRGEHVRVARQSLEHWVRRILRHDGRVAQREGRLHTAKHGRSGVAHDGANPIRDDEIDGLRTLVMGTVSSVVDFVDRGVGNLRFEPHRPDGTHPRVAASVDERHGDLGVQKCEVHGGVEVGRGWRQDRREHLPRERPLGRSQDVRDELVGDERFVEIDQLQHFANRRRLGQSRPPEPDDVRRNRQPERRGVEQDRAAAQVGAVRAREDGDEAAERVADEKRLARLQNGFYKRDYLVAPR